jgi:hypothetical protein
LRKSPYQQVDKVFGHFRQYFTDYWVFPILEILGVVCYYDFDFGLFELSTSINEFMDELITITVANQ